MRDGARRPGSWVAVLALCLVAHYALGSEGIREPAPVVGGKLSLEEIAAFLSQDGVHEPFYPVPPRGFSLDDVVKNIPRDNPLTRAKVELGRQLYFDKRLSLDNTVSCATCHHPAMGFGDAAAVSTGIGGQKGTRSAPVVTNRLFSKAQFWDGRAASLEEQALGPIANPIEMGHTLDKAVQRLRSIAGYRLQFRAVFGEDVTARNLARAIAAFERTVLSGDSDWDVYDEARSYEGVELDDEDLDRALKQKVIEARAEALRRPLSESAKRGAKLFTGKANCSLCHTGANFSDELYHNLGVGMNRENPDWGRYAVTGEDKDRGAFRTPTLRNVADTAPYMHDGSEATLEEVVELYDKGGVKNKWLSERMKPLKLTAQEKADLVAFMKSLSGVVTPVTEPRLP